jgi:hypothetical protein
MKRQKDKQGINFLRMLPLGVRDRVIYNVSVRHEKNTWKIMTGRYSDMKDFINSSMIWADTREGREFWACLHDDGVRVAVSKHKDHLKTVPVRKP